jgi:hypothetical protein
MGGAVNSHYIIYWTENSIREEMSYICKSKTKKDTKAAERYLLKSSIVKGWKQVKRMQNENTDNGTLQDLIDELK